MLNSTEAHSTRNKIVFPRLSGESSPKREGRPEKETTEIKKLKTAEIT